MSLNRLLLLQPFSGGDKGASESYLADDYSFDLAISPDKLSAATYYATITRTSDAEEMNFNFPLDQDAIATWLGGSGGTFALVQDQSGNSKHIEQTTLALQFDYAIGINDKPVLRNTVNDTTKKMTTDGPVVGTDADFSIFSVASGGEAVDASQYNILVAFGGHSTGFWIGRFVSSAPLRERLEIWNNSASAKMPEGSYPNTGIEAKIITHIKKINSFSRHYWNGTLQISGDAAGYAAMTTTGVVTVGGPIGSLGTSRSWNGDIAELLIATSDLSDDQSDIEVDINSRWSVT